MDQPADDHTGGMYNDSNNENFHDALPFENEKDDAISKKHEEMHIDEINEEDTDATTFIRVIGNKKKRFRTTIKCIHVPGDSLNSKINNLYQVLANKDGFLECKRYFDRVKKEAWITAIFDSQQAALAATEIQLFEDNDFKLTLLKDRGDEEVQRRTLVVRDLPLDVNRRLLHTILEAQFGEIESLKLRLAGPWYRADVTFTDAEGIERKLDCWSIQYKKDLCRVAPAYFTREHIEARNANTVKLTNLPFGTTPIDLKEILIKVSAKTCFIPRTRSRYSRKRFAYVSFANEIDLRRVLTNVRVMYNDTELFWEAEDTKTCHKCGSPEHLVANCDEKESADNYRAQQKQFSNIYTRYKVNNNRNSNTNRQNSKSYNNNNNRFDKPKNNIPRNNTLPLTQSNNNDLQKMMENLLKSFNKDIEEKFDNITKQITDVNNRIKILEIKTGLDKSKPSHSGNVTGKNKSSPYNMTYIPTMAELEKTEKNRQVEEETLANTDKNTSSSKSTKNDSNNYKRPLPESDQSSGDDKEKNSKSSNPIKPRRKSIRLLKDEDKVINDNQQNAEIENIKRTQQNLEHGLQELKGLFQQFTIQWFNTQSNNGNGSASDRPHQ